MTEVVPLLDAWGSFATFREVFGVEDDSTWELPFHSFLLRGDGWTAIVDTGAGPPGEEPFLPDRQALLPQALAAAGMRPEDVDAVLFTHLHVDHAGWNIVDGAPFFSNARYLAHAADYEYFAETRPDRPYVRDQVLALHALGRLELFDAAETSPFPDVTLQHVPGHTPGHCIVRAGGVVILGDLAVHELQLADPDLAYDSETDSVEAATQRRRLLPDLAARKAVVALGHLRPPLGRLEADGEGFAWRPLD
jgi:glyoxylase-like metal-dependent hydrolase (beta-lactamase superfamily II)